MFHSGGIFQPLKILYQSYSDTKPFNVFFPKNMETGRKYMHHIFISSKKYDQKFNDSIIK
jgi:hypothetical protein